MRKLLYVLLIVGMLLTTTACSNNKNKKEPVDNKDALKFKEEYEKLNGEKASNGKINPEVSIDKDNAIKYSNADEILKILKSGSGVIYFGFPECPWCRNSVPALLETAKEVGISKVYYMNLLEESNILEVDSAGKVVVKREGTKEYNKLIEALKDYLPDYILEDSNGNKVETGQKRIFVPLVIFVHKGKIVGTHSTTVESHKDPYELLNADQKDELMNIFADYMYQVLGNVCDEEC